MLITCEVLTGAPKAPEAKITAAEADCEAKALTGRMC
jgi:hypothetical protein